LVWSGLLICKIRNNYEIIVEEVEGPPSLSFDKLRICFGGYKLKGVEEGRKK
jgi:hypothetical protein